MKIKVDDLDVSINGERILEGVSFETGDNEDNGVLVGLVGPNGAGKTTLIRAINGILGANSGTVELGGENIEGMSSKEISRMVATVPQNTDVSFEFGVEEIVRMGRNPHIGRFGTMDENDARIVEKAMERTGTLEFADRTINEISGGERQRVLLARGFAQETPILLLDEPTSSLDIKHQIDLFEIVREMVDDEGKTVVAAIHDLNLAARFCDELILLDNGRVVGTGEPDEVLTRDNIETAFGTRVSVTEHPVTGTPHVTAIGDGGERREETELRRKRNSD